MLWGWVTCHLDCDRLPQRRVLIRFEYPTLSGPGSRGWLLIEHGDAEICEKYPGGEEDLIVVVNDPVAFARWVSESSNGATPCVPGRSRSVAPESWHGHCPLGTAASKQSSVNPHRYPQPPPLERHQVNGLDQHSPFGTTRCTAPPAP